MTLYAVGRGAGHEGATLAATSQIELAKKMRDHHVHRQNSGPLQWDVYETWEASAEALFEDPLGTLAALTKPVAVVSRMQPIPEGETEARLVVEETIVREWASWSQKEQAEHDARIEQARARMKERANALG